MKKRPERVLYLAVRGMLPKSAVLRKQRMTRLLMYRDSEHPHLAQLPPLPIVKEDLNVDPSLPMKEQIRLYEEIEEERLAALGITKEEKEARDRKAILEELAKAGISLPNAP
jgi:5'-3' exonuclease